MAVPFSNSKLRVPQGFQGLLERMAKEILLMQPHDIYAFSAMYFEDLLNQRDGASESPDPVAKVAQINDRTYNNDVFKDPDITTNDPIQEKAAITIQSKYRQTEAKEIADELRKEKAAIKIQSCARGFVARQQVKAIRAERDHTVDDEEDEEIGKLMTSEDYEKATSPVSSRLASADVHEKSSARDSPGEMKSRSSRAASSVHSALRASPGVSPKPAATATQRSAKSLQGDTVAETTAALAMGINDDKKEQQPAEDHFITYSSAPDSSWNEENAAKSNEDEEPLVGCSFPTESPSNLDEFALSVPGVLETVDIEEGPEVEAKDDLTSARSEKHQQVHDNNEEQYEYDSDASRAASKIQAGFRGMKVRKEHKGRKSDNESSARADEGSPEVRENAETESMAIVGDDNNEDDADLEKAATKIQAGFRGMKARMKVSELKGHERSEVEDVKEEQQEEETSDEISGTMLGVQAGLHWLEASEQEGSKVENNVVKETEGEIDEMQPMDDKISDAALAVQVGLQWMRESETESCKDENAVTNEKEREDDENATEIKINKPPANDAALDQEDSDPDVERAATKIQAGFRGMKVRRELQSSQKKDPNDKDGSGIGSSMTVEKDSEQQQVVMEEEKPVANDDDPNIEAAITKIQASFRGFKTRKDMKLVKQDDDNDGVNHQHHHQLHQEDLTDTAGEMEAVCDEPQASRHPTPHDEKSKDATDASAAEEEAVVWNDPDADVAVEDAASKIQAGFRGYKTRKELKRRDVGEFPVAVASPSPSKANTELTLHPNETQDSAAEPESSSLDDAATKIQAGFKGYKTRKELQEKGARQRTNSDKVVTADDDIETA